MKANNVRVESLFALVAVGMFVYWLGSAIYEGFERGNPAFVAVFDAVGRLVNGGSNAKN